VENQAELKAQLAEVTVAERADLKDAHALVPSRLLSLASVSTPPS